MHIFGFFCTSYKITLNEPFFFFHFLPPSKFTYVSVRAHHMLTISCLLSILHAVLTLWQNGQYSVLNYCIANAVVQAPFVFLIAICCSTPVYWITDMNSDGGRYILFVLVMFLMLFVIESLAQLVGIVIKVGTTGSIFLVFIVVDRLLIAVTRYLYFLFSAEVFPFSYNIH